MTMIAYKYKLIEPNIVDEIRKDAQAAEANGYLTESQMAVIHQQKWFRIFVPHALGGLELALPEAVRLEEEIARVDGSVGWTVTLCGGASLFVGFLQPSMRKEITEVKNLCIAGSGMDTGTARVASNGYYVSGTWPYATGAKYADYFTANCIVEGTGEVKSFVLRKNEVQVQNTWNLFGMKATASHAFSVKSLRIPFERSFVISASNATLTDALYRYPFLQLAECTLAVNILGMTSRFFELAEEILTLKKHSRGLKALENFADSLDEARTRFYDALDRSWHKHHDNSATSIDFEEVSRVSKELAHLARNQANEMFPYCGLTAARIDQPISRVWRDLNTAGQHSLLL